MTDLPTDTVADVPNFADGVEQVPEIKEAEPAVAAVVDGNTSEEPSVTGVQATAAGIVATLEAAAAAAAEDDGSTIERTATPGSRTSTPPLGGPAAAPKKFARVDVTKKFLSKSGTPAPAAKAIARTSSSPVPIAQPNRIVSTKLMTAPISKTSSSSSPKPPAPPPVANTASPWAKTSVPDTGDKASLGLQQPVPKKLGNLGNLGGQGGLKGPQKMAWRAVPDGNQARTAMSRDFPTANEIAEGQKAAQMAAQAQEAHNQALLQSINAFTHLDMKEDRWDEDDDDDDPINFGNGPPPGPVEKAERFGNDDFDRSWPGREERAGPPRDSRVLFNASNNRLEAQQLQVRGPPPAPTRVMSRPDRDVPPHAPAPNMQQAQAHAQASDRPLPPHLAAGVQGRAPPPHLQSQPQPQPQAYAHQEERNVRPNMMQGPPPPPGVGTGRTAWNIAAGPPAARNGDMRRPSDSRPARPSPTKPTAVLPTAPTQATAPPAQERAQAQAQAQAQAPAAVLPDEQAAEMHNAAEKARQRRLADEAERVAAQERAKQKAKELEARFGPRPEPKGAVATPAIAAAVQEPPKVPPGLNGRPSQEQLPLPAQRPPPPRQVHQPQQPRQLQQVAIPTQQQQQQQQRPQPQQPQFTIAQRPKPEERPVETSWRRAAPSVPVPAPAPGPGAAAAAPEVPVRSPIAQIPPTASQVHAAQIAAIMPTAHSPTAPVVRLPGQYVPEPEEADGKFDDVLARIQASMSGSASKPSPSAPEPPAPIAAPTAAPVPAPAPTSGTKGYFESTQIDPPQSPPPAWRTYTVRLPPPGRALPPIPLSRIRAAETLAPPPKGWSQTFNPPLEGMDKCHVLIPRPLATRIQSVLNGGQPGIAVALPKGSLDRAPPKKEKKKAVERPIVEAPAVPVEALIEPWTEAPARKKSPVKTSTAAKAERQGVFAQEAVGMSSAGRRDSLPGGVRFMVSSELEGDSLLDEVNKMSLETVDEGMGDGAAKTPGQETPPQRSTQPPSPTGTPWGRQHDRLKSVWDSANEKQEEVPMYPSLNTPLTSETTNTETKPGYEARPNGWPANPYQNYSVQGQVWSPTYGPSMAQPGYGFQQDDKRRAAYGDGYYGQVQPAAAPQPQQFPAGYPYTPAQVNAYRQAQAASTPFYGPSVSQAILANGAHGARRGRFEHGGQSRASSYGNVPNAQIRHNAQQLLHQQQLQARQQAIMQQQQQQQQQQAQGQAQQGGYFGGIAKDKRSEK